MALRDREALLRLGQHADLEVACDAWLGLLDLGPPPTDVEPFEPLLCRVLEASRHPREERPRVGEEVSLRWDRILAALERWGTPAALVALSSRSEQILPLQIRRRIPATAAAIRARHAHGRGSLALADGDPGGRVSLVDPRR